MYRLVLRLDVGGKAEDFTLNDFSGKPVRLGDMIGKGIVFLTFYNGGFDPESVKYLKELSESYGKLGDLGVEIVAITPELPVKAKSTVDSLHLPFTVLCDTDLKVAKQYDVYNPAMEWCWPAGFVIDREGTIQYAFRGVSPPNTPPVPYLLKKFEQMHGARKTGAPAATAR